MSTAPAPLVGLDARAMQKGGFKSHAGRGIGRYVAELVAELVRQAEPGTLRLLADAGVELEGAPPTLPVEPIYDEPWARPLASLTVHVRQHVIWPRGLADVDVDLVHFFSQTDAPARLARRYVVSVMDVIPHRMEELYIAGKSRFRYKFGRFLERRAMRGATGLLAISEFTKRDLVSLLGIPPDRVVVTPLGIDPRFRPPAEREVQATRRRHQLSLPYLLYVGGIDRRKNVPLLLEMLERLLAGRHVVELVLAGAYRDDPDFPALAAEIQRRGLERSVRLLGYVPDDELPALYAGAAAFVFPSLYEGFGLPPLEAMACGAPVIASKATSLPEVLGDAAVLLDPRDVAGFAAAAGALVDRADERKRLGEAGQRQAAGFRWEKTARQTLQAYRAFAGIKPS